MAKQLVGKEYADMSEKYQGRVSEDTFNRRQKAQRMAGDALKDMTAKERNKDNYNVTDLKDFDLTAGGAGGTTGRGYSDGGTADDSSDDTFGRGRGRFSKRDAKSLYKRGNFSAQELMDYGNSLDESKDQIFGSKAQRFLQRKLGEVTTPDKPNDTTPNNPPPKPGDDADRGVPDVDIALPGTGGDGGGNATNVNITDNDVISNVTGDNNVIEQNVDNSVSQQSYGGSTYDYTFNPGRFYPIPYRARGLDLY